MLVLIVRSVTNKRKNKSSKNGQVQVHTSAEGHLKEKL